MRTTHIARVLALSGLALIPPACTLRPPPNQAQPAPDTGALPNQHPFPPETIIVHPLTRLTTNPDTGNKRIEAHFELLDRYGHTVKALGEVVLELRTSDPGTATGAGPRQLARWTKEMRAPDENARPFDRITRTYRLTLADLPGNLPPEANLSLIVRYTTADGRVLSAERRFGG